MTFRSPPRALVLSWLGLVTLLAVTVFVSYQPLGAFNTGLALVIAAAKALLVALIFMELRRGSALTIAVAAAGLFWLAIMLWLALGDYVTRPGFRVAHPSRYEGGSLKAWMPNTSDFRV